MLFKKLKKTKIITALANYIFRCYIALIFYTCKFIRLDAPEASKAIENNKQIIFAIWHSRILIFPKLDLPKVTAVVSSHGDGEFIANLLKVYGHKTTRGSSRKEGITAMRGLLRTLKQEKRCICITPDGPKGPRYKINGSITELATRLKLPIIPLCFSASSAIVLNTWDRFIIPLPFTTIYIEEGEPIYFETANKNDDLLAEKMFNQMVALDNKAKLKIDY